jgi:hypothetical protein
LSKSTTTTTTTEECANFPTSSIPFKSFKHVHAINLSTIQQPISLLVSAIEQEMCPQFRSILYLLFSNTGGFKIILFFKILNFQKKSIAHNF